MDNTKKPPKKTGLGRGLGIASLIRTQEEPETTLPLNADTVAQLDINKVEPNPDQPRKQFNKEALEELALSIQEYGILQPILVNDIGDGYYKIVAGERRYRAARIAKLTTIPAIIKTYPEMEALQIALIENIQRQDLNPIEEALCYKQLEEYFFHRKEDIAKKVGKSRNTIAQRINLLELAPEVQQLLTDGDITASHGLKLVTLDDETLQIQVALEIADKGLSLRETSELIEKLKNLQDAPEPENRLFKANPFETLETTLESIWGTKVRVKGKPHRGRIEIDYYSQEEMERVVEYLKTIRR